MKGLYSGRQIKDLKGRSQRVTRSQTAAGAYAAITLKYGSVEDSAKYFHTGKGNWNKYSLQNDKKRTGKLAASIEEWRERPHKLDFKGVDTKDGVSGKKPRFSVTSLKPSAKLAGRKGKSQVKATSKAILKNVVKPKPIKANHVYASFMRPLWIGFNPGVQYREIKVTDAHKDLRFNRKPHAVIVTSQPIPEDKIKSLELTDLIKGKKLAKEVKRIKGLSFLDDNMRESLVSQVLAGKDKAVINKYIEKGKQLAEKKQKKQKFSMTSLKGSDKPTARKVMALGKLNGIPVNRMQRARKVIKGGFNFRTGFTWITNGNTYKITSITGTTGNKNIKYVNMKNPNKTYVTNEKDLTFDLRLNKNVREINKKQAEDNAKWAKVEAEQKKKEEAEYQKQLEGLEGFEQTISALRRPKVIETLNTLIRSNGKVIKRKEAVIERVKAGWTVENKTYTTSRKIHGERIGKDHNETVLTNGNLIFSLNKTEADFARYLIKKHGIKPKLSLSALKHSGKLTSRNTKNPTAPKGYKPKTKIILSKAPKITINQHFTKGKKSGSYAPTKTVNTPLEAFKIYMRHKDKYDVGLLFEAGPGTLTTADEITMAARVDTPSVIYNAILKKLNLDKYYAYLKYADDPMKLKTSPLRTLSLRGNWDQGAVL